MVRFCGAQLQLFSKVEEVNKAGNSDKSIKITCLYLTCLKIEVHDNILSNVTTIKLKSSLGIAIKDFENTQDFKKLRVTAPKSLK